jgi:hypothetical protein
LTALELRLKPKRAKRKITEIGKAGKISCFWNVFFPTVPKISIDSALSSSYFA